MQGQKEVQPLEYIAILEDKTKPSNLRAEFLYFNADNEIIDISKEVAMSPECQSVILCYKTVINQDYLFCKQGIESGSLTPEQVQNLLS